VEKEEKVTLEQCTPCLIYAHSRCYLIKKESLKINFMSLKEQQFCSAILIFSFFYIVYCSLFSIGNNNGTFLVAQSENKILLVILARRKNLNHNKNAMASSLSFNSIRKKC
jgi:hypothetical protein